MDRFKTLVVSFRWREVEHSGRSVQHQAEEPSLPTAMNPKLSSVLPPQSGHRTHGNWSKQESLAMCSNNQMRALSLRTSAILFARFAHLGEGISHRTTMLRLEGLVSRSPNLHRLSGLVGIRQSRMASVSASLQAGRDCHRAELARA